MLRPARTGDSPAASLRTSGDHRGPNPTRLARLSRLGRSANQDVNRFFTILFALVLSVPAFAQLKLGKSDSLLEPEKAFRFSARSLDSSSVEVRFAIADGYYMYRERMRFAAEGNPAVRLGAADFPQGEKHKDEFFGEAETYRKEVRVRIPAAGSGAFDLKVTSQGCADIGV